jgi:TonB family protein
MSRLAPISAGLLAVLFAAPQAAQAASSRAEVDQLVWQGIAKCWAPLAEGAHVVRVQFELNRDGSLAGAPVVLEARPAASGTAVEAAIKAVRDCTPIALPPEAYDYWRYVTIRFDASIPGRPFGASAWPQ